MKYFIYILSLLFIFSTSASKAQKAKEKARANIVLLKNGALFIRLKTSQLKINALKKIGKEKESEEIRMSQEATNLSIIKAFKENFNFCQVYFFYSNHSTEVKEGKYKAIIFNTDMKIDSSFSSDNYLIGEFDESETTQLDAFIIKDKNYDQLKAPFPYLIKKNQALVSTRSYDDIIFILNEKLISFYNKKQ